MVTYRISGLTLALDEELEGLKEQIASALCLPQSDIVSLQIVKKSIDARKRRAPRFVYIVDVSVRKGEVLPGVRGRGMCIELLTEIPREPRLSVKIKPPRRPVVVGCGPAGLFAALTLARGGAPPLLLERGKAVPERVIDVETFWEKGVLNTESHVHYGEGGAGTFSDGKLTSRVKSPYTSWVKRIFVDAGASSEILVDARPHIGTDRLREVVGNLRRKLIDLGCEIRFNSRVTDLLIHRGVLRGVVVDGREEIATDCLVLATGQSAEDTYRMLHARGVRLEPKSFAIGLRVEHPQELIDSMQYGQWKEHPVLPPADYFLTARLEERERSVYTFCMCPGGNVIGCSSEQGGVVTNGMSRSLRDGIYANSAIVVTVHPNDFAGTCAHPLNGIAFRRCWEEKAFVLGGGNYYAPAQGMVDFLRDREGPLPHPGTFLPGVNPAPLNCALPRFVVDALKGGIHRFEKKMRGFLTGEALLTGVETRTSSPVRIVRGPDGQSVVVEGLYPCGEGAGYAGGIISSALDGIRAAEHILKG